MTRTPAITVLALAILLPVAVRAQSITVSPIVPGSSRAEIMMAATFEQPPDVNSVPRCLEFGVPCLTPRTMPDFGGALAAALHLDDHAAIVAEASASRNAWFAFTSRCAPAGGAVQVQCPEARMNIVRSALIGPRIRAGEAWALASDPPLRVFAQVLAGSQWSDVVSRRTVIQPGVGVEVYFHHGAILQGEIDYQWTSGSNRDLPTLRTVVGLTFPIG